MKFAAVGHCIYCGSTEPPLSDEHIIPFALNGTSILLKASCETCAKITRDFEQTVARTIYGPLRIKRGFQTRRKKERPKSLPVYTKNAFGEKLRIDVPIENYPNFFVAVNAPPPGIFEGIEPSEFNPELSISMKVDSVDFFKTMDSMFLENMLVECNFDWGAFFRQIAKIGHCYAFACMRGREYISLLPDIILGKSNHLSYYVGGIEDSEFLSEGDLSQSTVSLSLITKPSGYYLAALIQILGAGTLHPYQAVVGKIQDLDKFMTAWIDSQAFLETTQKQK